MPWGLLCAWWTILLGVVVDCLILPPIHWNQSNPMFKTSNNDHIIEVKLNDEVDFVCPFSRSADEGQDELYIVFQVTKEEYDTCMLYPGRRKNLVVNCSTPKERKRFTIIFEKYSSIPNGREFEEGGAYYFITTSTGRPEGLVNPHEGACLYSNMKLTIRVCCETTTTLPTTPLSTLHINQSTNTSLDPAHRSTTIPGASSPVTPQRTTSLPTASSTTTTTTVSTTTVTSKRRTTATRTRWKPTTKYPSTKMDEKEKEDKDYNHENEVLPNKEHLVNRSSATSLSIPVLTTALLATLVAARCLVQR